MEEIEAHVCDCCGCTPTEDNEVLYRTDPFAEEIHDIIIWQWMCDNCYDDSCDEI